MSRMCSYDDQGEYTCDTDRDGVCLYCEHVNRDSQVPDVIYVDNLTEAAFRSPDGEGRYHYDDLDSAIDDSFEEDPKVVYVEGWSDD